MADGDAARVTGETTELLQAERAYRDQMYTVLAAVRTGGVQEGQEEAAVTGQLTEPERGGEAVPEGPVSTVALD